VSTHYFSWSIFLLSPSFFFFGTNLGIAEPRCNLIVNPPVRFSEEALARDIPDNEDALFCALTLVKIPPFVGGGGLTGGCIVRQDPRTHHWTFQSTPPRLPGTECEVTCIKTIECKGGEETGR
jgi:hypothetical protein